MDKEAEIVEAVSINFIYICRSKAMNAIDRKITEFSCKTIFKPKKSAAEDLLTDEQYIYRFPFAEANDNKMSVRNGTDSNIIAFNDSEHHLVYFYVRSEEIEGLNISMHSL